MQTGDRRILIILGALCAAIALAWTFATVAGRGAGEDGAAGGTAQASATPSPTGGETVASVTVDENGNATVTGTLAEADEQAQDLPTATPAPAKPKRPVARKPTIVQRPIAFDDARKADMAAYSQRHYGEASYELTDPKVIVEHFTVTSTFDAAYNIFAPNRADAELGEKPGTCAHFVVDTDGTIYQLVSLSIRCRHTIGINDTAIGIEQVAMSAQEILGRPAQLAAIIRLSAWLRCRYGIAVSDIIGHAESLSSPYHHENVERLKTQTHSDWTTPQAAKLRSRIRRYACP